MSPLLYICISLHHTPLRPLQALYNQDLNHYSFPVSLCFRRRFLGVSTSSREVDFINQRTRKVHSALRLKYKSKNWFSKLQQKKKESSSSIYKSREVALLVCQRLVIYNGIKTLQFHSVSILSCSDR